MVRGLLILWYSKYLDGSRTIDTLIFHVFGWYAYYRYFGILSISAFFGLLVLPIIGDCVFMYCSN